MTLIVPIFQTCLAVEKMVPGRLAPISIRSALALRLRY